MQKLAIIKPYGLVLFEAVLLVLYTRLRILNSYTVHEPRLSFGDTHDYLIIASQSLASARFWLSDKAFLIPLFFKILGSNPDVIFRVQLIFSIICWSVLAVTCAVVIRSYPLKFLVFAVVLGFSLSQQVILWDSLLLTESLHFSLAALFYSSALLLVRRWQNANAAVFIVLSALLGFARDTNAYMLLFAAAVLFGLFLLFKEHRLRFVLIGGAFTAIFLVSASLASAGHHGNAALLNVLAGRILADKEYTSYMAGQGMPVSYLSLPGGDKAAEWDPLWDPRLASLREWARDHGKPALHRLPLAFQGRHVAEAAAGPHRRARSKSSLLRGNRFPAYPGTHPLCRALVSHALRCDSFSGGQFGRRLPERHCPAAEEGPVASAVADDPARLSSDRVRME